VIDCPDPVNLATTQLLPFLAVTGNEEAWCAFVQRYRPRMLRWCGRLQADDAEEVVSRVLHKLVIGLARGAYQRQRPGSFRGWLRAVVAHEIVDLGRQRRPVCSDSGKLDEWPDPRLDVLGLDELADEMDAQLRSEYERAEEICARVRQRVLPRTWEAFSRSYLNGQDVREVATHLGLTLSGVYKARERVRLLLEDEGKADVRAQ
jgi:RNA polymerase sigma factor (sigma-70 family)